jgi:hypothetical protein
MAFMNQKKINISVDDLPRFDRDFFGSAECISYIGSGSIGGKATGLAFIKDKLVSLFKENPFPGIDVTIPRLVVIATDVFDRFMQLNKLEEVISTETDDDRIAAAFIGAEFPAELVGDLRALISSVRTPLAVRSSSLLEDAMYEPFAGVYATKMIPNNQPDIDSRFKKLIEAIKFVYASTYFKAARDYHRAAGRPTADEKMAVIIQEVVGRRYNDRYYPHISGVARSYNFYPMGRAIPDEGVVDLALGLGKTIVDGGLVWSYSPAHPRAVPPVGSASEFLKMTQTNFWAVNMGKPPAYDPMRETEYLTQGELADAEYDGTLKYAASTYRPADDRIVMGIGADGPRLINFAPILVADLLPINKLIEKILKLCDEAVGSEVEVEFAMNINSDSNEPSSFGFLQVRPMVVSHAKIEIDDSDMTAEDVLLATDRVLGNGIVEDIEDVIFVDPDIFDAKNTRSIAMQLSELNSKILDENRRYLLIGFGRWGSSDPWLGIPVDWGQISGARAIVEATIPGMNVELSQGSHFFHNITSFQICYFSVNYMGEYKIDWDWLKKQKEVARTEFVRHVRLEKPLLIKVDGRRSRGVILK